MSEDNNIFAYVSSRVNNEDDISGKYFHSLKALHRKGLLTVLYQYAVDSNKICPGKSVSEWFWEFCENLDILRDSSEYVNQRVKLYRDGIVSPFILKYHRNVRSRKENEKLLLYLEEYSGMDMSNVNIKAIRMEELAS